MSIEAIEPKLGRVAPTTRADNGNAITAGEFSVLASDGLFSLEVENRSGMRQAKRYGELRFFVDKDDAMEESAFLVPLDRGRHRQELLRRGEQVAPA